MSSRSSWDHRKNKQKEALLLHSRRVEAQCVWPTQISPIITPLMNSVYLNHHRFKYQGEWRRLFALQYVLIQITLFSTNVRTQLICTRLNTLTHWKDTLLYSPWSAMRRRPLITYGSTFIGYKNNNSNRSQEIRRFGSTSYLFIPQLLCLRKEKHMVLFFVATFSSRWQSLWEITRVLRYLLFSKIFHLLHQL